MSIFLLNDNQKGSITLIALVFMVSFSILIAGLLPVIMNTFVSATSNNGNFNARPDLAEFFNSDMSTNNQENNSAGSVTLSGWSDQYVN